MHQNLPHSRGRRSWGSVENSQPRPRDRQAPDDPVLHSTSIPSQAPDRPHFTTHGFHYSLSKWMQINFFELHSSVGKGKEPRMTS